MCEDLSKFKKILRWQSVIKHKLSIEFLLLAARRFLFNQRQAIFIVSTVLLVKTELVFHCSLSYPTSYTLTKILFAYISSLSKNILSDLDTILSKKCPEFVDGTFFIRNRFFFVNLFLEN